MTTVTRCIRRVQTQTVSRSLRRGHWQQRCNSHLIAACPSQSPQLAAPVFLQWRFQSSSSSGSSSGNNKGEEGGPLTTHAQQQQEELEDDNSTFFRYLPEDQDEEDTKGNRSTNHNKKHKLDPSQYTTKIEIRMPDMEEGDTKITKWYKEEGDVVLRDDVLCDIETKHMSIGLTTDDEHPALMGKILVPASDEPVADDTLICYLLHKTKQIETRENDE